MGKLRGQFVNVRGKSLLKSDVDKRVKYQPVFLLRPEKLEKGVRRKRRE